MEETSKVGPFCIIGTNQNSPKKSIYKNSPLHNAIRQNSSENIHKLIQQKTYNNTVNTDGMSPLAFAAKSQTSLDTLKALIENGTDLNLPDNLGNTALYYAIQTGNKELVELLLQHKADPTRHNNEGEVLLFTAHKAWRTVAKFPDEPDYHDAYKIAEPFLIIYELMIKAVQQTNEERASLPKSSPLSLLKESLNQIVDDYEP